MVIGVCRSACKNVHSATSICALAAPPTEPNALLAIDGSHRPANQEEHLHSSAFSLTHQLLKQLYFYLLDTMLPTSSHISGK